MTGLDVIHGFGREAFFMERFFVILEHYQRMHWCNIMLNRWFGTRMGLIGGVVSLGTRMGDLDPGLGDVDPGDPRGEQRLVLNVLHRQLL